MRRLPKTITVTVKKEDLPKKVQALLEDKKWLNQHKLMHQDQYNAKVWICLLPWCPFRPSFGGKPSAIKEELQLLSKQEMEILEAKKS